MLEREIQNTREVDSWIPTEAFNVKVSTDSNNSDTV